MVTIPGAAIPLERVANLRDIGGWVVPGGRVRRGVLYRSAGLGMATASDLAGLAGLGIRTVFDLRTVGERAAQPDRVPSGARLVEADVLGDYADSVPAHMFELLQDPVRATAALADGRAEALLLGAYRQIVGSGSAHEAFRTMFRTLLDPGTPPALVHCTTGKDRTGWAVAALLLLAGVAQDDVMAEYLLTNSQLLPALAPVFDSFGRGGGDPSVLEPVLGVRPEYLRIAIDDALARHGSIEGYFGDALGLDPDAQEALRVVLVEPVR